MASRSIRWLTEHLCDDYHLSPFIQIPHRCLSGQDDSLTTCPLADMADMTEVAKESTGESSQTCQDHHLSPQKVMTLSEEFT